MTDDDRSIREIVKQIEAAWNASDSAGFAAPFAPDADFVDILCRRHQGRAVIEAGHRQIFDTIYKGSRCEYKVERIRFVRPDVAVVFTRARLLSSLGAEVDNPLRDSYEGEGMQEAQARPTLILAKDLGNWRIVAFQNTKIAEAISESEKNPESAAR